MNKKVNYFQLVIASVESWGGLLDGSVHLGRHAVFKYFYHRFKRFYGV